MLVDNHRRPELIRAVAAKGGSKCVGQGQTSRVERHANLSICTQPIQFGHLLSCCDASGDGHPGVTGHFDHFGHQIHAGAAHTAFTLNEGDQKTAHIVSQSLHLPKNALSRSLGPSFDHHVAISGIQCGDKPIFWQLFKKVRLCSGADDNCLGPCIEPASSRAKIADASADAAGILSAQFTN